MIYGRMLLILERLKNIGKGLFEGFYQHRLLENASALSFYTLMSLVPILAVLFGIAKGFGFEAILRKEVIGAVPNQEALAEQLIYYSQKLLEETRGGLIAGFGVLFLLWSFLGLLGNFERALNDIWQVKEGRTYSRRMGDFLGFIFITPFFFVIISSVSLFLTSEVVDFFQKREMMDQMSPFLYVIFKIIPVFLTFIVFNFFYFYLPNHRVPFYPTIFASLCMAIIFHLVQWGYVYFQLSISQYGTVYGSFAAIPLFLIWLQISWFITLLGAELSYRFSKN